jgi:hypothetical protein
MLQPSAASNQNNTQQQQSMDLEVAVPEDQRPVNELAALKQAWLYSWVRLAEIAYTVSLTTSQPS